MIHISPNYLINVRTTIRTQPIFNLSATIDRSRRKYKIILVTGLYEIIPNVSEHIFVRDARPEI